MYIPSIIHMIWFGKNPYPKIVTECVESWKKYFPNYEIKIWNEETFDINSCAFVKEAYEAKKWAFVSDYVRLYALYNYGGIYIDSDVQVLKNFENLLVNEHVVTGYEDTMWIPAAVMASEKENCWIKKLLKYYDDRHFIKEDGTYDMKPNTAIITELSKKECGFKFGDDFINYGNVRLYSTDVFQPYKKEKFDLKDDDNLRHITDFYIIKKNTYCIHHNTTTWVDKKSGFVYNIKNLVRKYMPRELVEQLREIYYNKINKW